jgi:3-deoxy-manno-octulosonate cytidylyltransferase (CMP-KDO synthetase)
MKIVGIVPARMGSSRFYGKPLHPICGRPMIEHVVERAKMFPSWDGLFLATCDAEIQKFGQSKDWQVLMTSDKHTRCLDRVAEAVAKCGLSMAEDDIVVCVQGDEPMLHPEMISAVLKPLTSDKSVLCTVLAMEIGSNEQFINPDTVKIVHDMKGDVLYTSRSPIPYCKEFSISLGARRIYGIFAFRWDFLKKFNSLPESPLEIVESCDSNRIMDHGFKERIAPYPYQPSFSVDSPSDIGLVEAAMQIDPLWGKY